MKKCPNCSDGYHIVHQDCRAPNGRRYSQNIRRECPVCKGTNEVSEQVMQRVEICHQWREERRESDKSVRKEAERLGMTPSHLSKLENVRGTDEEFAEWKQSRKNAQGRKREN